MRGAGVNSSRGSRDCPSPLFLREGPLLAFRLSFKQGAQGGMESPRHDGRVAAGAGAEASDAGAEEGYGLCPSPLKPCYPLYNPFSFNGTVVIYSTNALIQNTLDRGT